MSIYHLCMTLLVVLLAVHLVAFLQLVSKRHSRLPARIKEARELAILVVCLITWPSCSLLILFGMSAVGGGFT